ncbi:MAG: hypothetical protein ACOCU8_03480 [Patescibacteria group bacterium]
MDILSKLFGSGPRVRMVRLFLFNPEVIFEKDEIRRRAKVTPVQLRKELKILADIGMIKTKSGKDKGKVWMLNPNWLLIGQMRALLKADFLRRKQEFVRRFRNCGKINLLIVSGVFIEDEDRRVDLLVVGDRLKKPVIDNIIKGVEADLGRELNYSILETGDFEYRMNTSDKFVRDVLDYPHEKIINKLIL